MAARITDEEWDKLSPENFETHSLLRAVDAMDELRDDLNDGEDAAPPQLRTDLLKLHQLAMAVINEVPRGRFASRPASGRSESAAPLSSSARPPPIGEGGVFLCVLSF